MKKVKSIVLWMLSVFLLLMAAVLFTESIHGGLLMFAAAMLCNPLFLKLVTKGGKKIKPYFVVPAVVVLFFTAILTSPVETPPNQEQTEAVMQTSKQTESESVLLAEQEEITKESRISSEESLAETDGQTKAGGAEEIKTGDLEGTEADETADTEMTVHYLDVGQGDCMLLACDGEYMLIDAGDNSKGTAVQNYLTKQGVKTLKYVIGTHPDADHVGGLDVILYKFDCETVMLPDISKDTKTYRDVLDTMDQKGYTNTLPAAGEEFMLGSASCMLLGPRTSYEDANNNSVVILVTHGTNKFLFMGDAEAEAEEDILRGGADVKADVIKVGHHGSRYSSSESFLQAVTPSYAVISCGEDNKYGHPHAKTLNALRAMGVEVFRSDEQGTIVAVSDGSKITWNSAPSDTWKAGEPTGGSGTADSGRSESGQSGTESKAKQDGAGQDNAGKADTETANAVENGTDVSAGIDGAEGAVSTQGSVQEQDDQQGETQEEDGAVQAVQPVEEAVTAGNYIGNKNNDRLHKATCSYLPDEKNRAYFSTREEAVAAGYDIPCKKCNP